MLLRVKVTPNAQSNKLVGWHPSPVFGKVLRIRIQSPATDGKANKAVKTFLAKSLKLPQSKVRHIKGFTSRVKTFEVPDDTVLPIPPSGSGQ